MIDIHCHILPGVDDGPKSLEDALMMIDMAYKDGVKCVIATPHLNHPLEFNPESGIKESYDLLRTEIKKRYDDFGIVLGSELYIDRMYHKILSEKPYAFTIAGTNYVLMEFQPNVKHDEIVEVVHEFIIKGYRPIIAHIEMYKCLNGHIDRVRSIRNEGAYIQVTGSSVIGKMGKDTTQFLRKIIKSGLVDFVASDGHGHERRRPLLREAYKAVEALTSGKEAKRIFDENPRLLISGKHIPQPTYTIKTGKSVLRKLNIIAASVAIIALSISAIAGLLGRDEASSDGMQIQLNTEINAINSALIAEIIEEDTVDIEAEAIVGSAETASIQPATTQPAPTQPSQNSIEARYHEALMILRTDYITRLDDIVSNIKIARSNISNDVQREQIIEAYIDEIVAMEQNSDNIVSDLLYDMQNELEKYRYDVSKVQEFRDTYHQTKAQKRDAYLNELNIP